MGRAEQPALVRVSRRLPGFARSGTEDVRTERGGVLNGKPRSGSRTEASVEQRAVRARLPTPVGESARVPLLRRRRFDVSLHALSTGSPAVFGRASESFFPAPRCAPSLTRSGAAPGHHSAKLDRFLLGHGFVLPIFNVRFRTYSFTIRCLDLRREYLICVREGWRANLPQRIPFLAARCRPFRRNRPYAGLSLR